MLSRKIYYQLKPVIPRRLQIALRREMMRRKLSRVKDIWPIDPHAAKVPPNWKGWPEGKKFALVLTHDVESAKGHAKTEKLMHLEMGLGFRSSFNFVPERYSVSPELRCLLIQNEFEVGVHGLKHDGKLYQSEKNFNERAIRINHYLKEWNAIGFRSPFMHHNLEWLRRLDIIYDASTFDTDPFEPQSDGMQTIFPFWVDGNDDRRGYVELPYTLVQDFTLFIIMQEKSIDIWQRKLDWVAENGGMALVNVHPDYMNFEGSQLGLEEFPAEYYTKFLKHIKKRFSGQYWPALPRDVAHFYKNELQKSCETMANPWSLKAPSFLQN